MVRTALTALMPLLVAGCFTLHINLPSLPEATPASVETRVLIPPT
jgi:hypothetical protein